MGARGAAYARKAVLEDAAFQELIGDFAHYGAPVAIGRREALVVRGVKRAEVLAHEAKERRRLRAARLVELVDARGGACGDRGHRARRSEVQERRAYARSARTPSPDYRARCLFSAGRAAV